MRQRRIAIFLAASLVLLAGCGPKTTHRVVATQHSTLSIVQAFQDAEIAEFQKGFVPPDLHVKMQETVGKIALGFKDLDNALAANADAKTLKAKLDNLYTLADSLNTDGLTFIKNPTTKATLEVALDAIKAIIDNALTEVQ